MLLLLIASAIIGQATPDQGFEWEVSVQDVKTKEMKTYHTFDTVNFKAGPFTCGVEVTTMTSEKPYHQYASIECRREVANEVVSMTAISDSCPLDKGPEHGLGYLAASIGHKETIDARFVVKTKCIKI